MKGGHKKIAVALLLILLTAIMTGSVHAKTIEVKCSYLGGCGLQPDCFETIYEAISSADPDDTIKVYSCTVDHPYTGPNGDSIVINKNLTLIGSGPQTTFISTNGNGIHVNPYLIAMISGFSITASHEGIYTEGGTQTIIKNNAIVSNRNNGIYIHCSESTITNNTIAYNSKNGIYADDCASLPSSITVSNNIVYSNGSYGLYLGSERETITYNDVYANTSGNYYGCSPGTGDLNPPQNPLFMDPSCGNFVLQSGSPCKNAGSSGADLDPDGTQNDMGAYGGPFAAPFWPYPPCAPIITNLTVTPTAVQKGGTISIKATGEVW